MTPANILEIVVDDMRGDQIGYMPNVLKHLGVRGCTFTNARCNYALCQPCRVGILSGKNSKYHKVYGNGAGAATASPAVFDFNNTQAKWLHDGGYRTAMLGKFLHTTGLVAPTQTAGWDYIRELNDAANQTAWGYTVNDGTDSATPSPVPYQPQYLRDEALSFMGGGEPWFIYLTPTSPHYPFEPYPTDVTRYDSVVKEPVVETGAATKPTWIGSAADITEAQKIVFRQTWRQQVQELYSLDRYLGDILSTVDFTDTVVIFTSDNGLYYGEHRNPTPGIAKVDLYDCCAKVPMIIRGPGFPNRLVTAPVSPVDIGATVADVGGVTPGLTQDGVSMKTIANNPAAYAGRWMLHQKGSPSNDGTLASEFLLSSMHADGVTNDQWRYTVYFDGQIEFYDFVNDPNEQTNLHGNVSYSAQEAAAAAALAARV